MSACEPCSDVYDPNACWAGVWRGRGRSSTGLRIYLVIVTDGVPTWGGRSLVEAKQHMVQQIRMLVESFPISVVVRLATDEPAVVQFWNSVDADQVALTCYAAQNRSPRPAWSV